ncbi:MULTISPECIES: type II toxin-antitoxin system YafO family toxin [Pseudomonas]|jgi:mRNA interferase YafO|uniref:Type II toxin-antitoxin system YafO family toxin n=1 Tax=Pseudomonas neuropathica TaxID=2730425 RepID=A0ACC7MPG6_9PSED|nr:MULTISPECIES: type II toxin-antitoxin system YafO family toxin [Pseudomonas]MDD2104034.1 type II toxin-antitoxin system YafO family toxin [Pseudomonas putida]MEB2626709.1 type II toxin-antitoxin system YafO family toxin [Pseudomonas sp. YuFO8]
MPAVKISALFEQIGNWQNFAAHFYNYKVCNELPAIFGRDERLDLCDMYHIHLASTQAIQERWAKINRQYYRTALVNDPDNDFWLIYAYDAFRDEYLLLTVTGPDAHNRREWGSFLRSVHYEIVEPWVIGKIIFPDLDEL